MIHGRADAAVVLVNDKVEQTRASLQDARNGTDTLRTIIKGSAQAVLDNKLKESGLDELERRAQTGIQRGQNLLELSVTAAELMQQLLASVDGDGERFVPQLDRLQSAQSRLATAAERLAEMQRHLAELRERRNVVAESAGQVARLALALLVELEAVEQGLDAFQDHLHNIQSRLDAWKNTVSAWITGIAVLATLLLAWIGAGQLSLAIHGWRGLRSRRL